MRILPKEYVEQQFLIYAGYPKRKHTGVYEGGCPTCREGRSWGVKKRLFYIPEYNNIHCKNCHKSWNTAEWIHDVSGKSYFEISLEAKDYEYIPAELLTDSERTTYEFESANLPLDAINLSNEQQLEYYRHNTTVKKCLNFIKSRRLDTAINRPNTFYLSLVDFTHKNRLCIPFMGDNSNISFYQTRSFLENVDDDLPKYLGKAGGSKPLFGVNNISENLDNIFIFEGPIDSMFVRNGVAIAGVDLNSDQKAELKSYPFHEKIWVLDNQHIDNTAREVTKQLLDAGETVFIWKKGLEAFKDINDICIHKKINEFPMAYIIENSFSGIKGKFQMTKCGL